MFNVMLLGNGRCHGNRITADRHLPIAPLVGELWHFQHFPIWRKSAILNWNFAIFSPPTKSTTWFDYPVKIWCRSIFAVGL